MFGKNIKFLRKKNDLSQEDLSQKLGYKSFTTIQKWEDEKAEPPLNKFDIIANMFNVSMDDLYNRDLSKYFDNKDKDEIKNLDIIKNHNLDLSNNVKEHLNKYKQLKEPRQNRVDKITDMELDEQRQEELRSSSVSFLKG
ncbi:helix-turn-helix domain-containing protein [Anaerofustis stercorihominis]|uniref:helix-turn-helix domain-containing protein n=1 Tax=Anaerofustis stercorihominis TaxID=214853 RepID=UPI0026718C59|nr:helix-turn-helix transcriptional regulator [Anaerofustis stercorihominis]